jgi:L,D-peptidoglycan transpeptidase YkuD (ErfK/YbiS/YcfS/YnhG family)
MSIRVKSNYLIYNGNKFRCSIGNGGFSSQKKEGDRCTPSGIFQITDVFYRQDKITNLSSNFKLKKISPLDGWCDDPNHKKYNTKIQFPFSYSAEKFFRQDDVYDIICVTNHNQNPIIPGAGSAIFIHIAHDNYSATEGCIALKKSDLQEILLTMSKNTNIEIGP